MWVSSALFRLGTPADAAWDSMLYQLTHTNMKTFLGAVLALGLFAFAMPVLAADGTISGTVTHAADGTPVVGVYLSATNTTTSVASYVYGTGADGSYSFTLEPGTYDIATYTYTAVEPGISFIQKTQTLTLASGETKSGQNFAITRRGKFTGTVTAAGSGTALSGAVMYFYHASGTTTGYGYATTTSTGSYTATPTPNDSTISSTGSYTIYATKPGYFGAMISGASLTADETTVTQNIAMTAASTVTGTVLDSSGAAVADATVTLTRSGGIYGVYTATTNASGVFTVSVYDLTNYNGTAVADYTVSVSKSGYITKTGAVTISSDGSALTGNNYTLTAAGVITGTVKTSAGAELSGVLVTADDSFGHTYSATTDASGAYTLTSLFPSTRYTLTMTKTNYVGQKLYKISVTSGATTSGKNATLPAAKTFSGTILAKSGNTAIDGAVISIFKRNKTRSELADFSYTTKSDGSFLFQNVSPGKYRVKVTKNGYVMVIQDSLTITGNVTGKNFSMDLGGSIYGRLTSGSTAVAAADVAVFALKNGKEVSYTSVSSDENGYYLVNGLKKGTYRLKITTTDYVTKVLNVTVKTGTQATKNVSLAIAGSVSGYITDKETGLPVSALVKVVGASAITWSDANGYFILDGLAPGTRRIYAVSAYYNTGAQQSISVSKGKVKTGVTFTLTPKQ